MGQYFHYVSFVFGYNCGNSYIYHKVIQEKIRIWGEVE